MYACINSDPFRNGSFISCVSATTEFFSPTVTFRGSWSFTGRLIDNSMHEVETRLKHDFRSGTNKFYGKRIFTREDLTFDKISMVFR